MKQLIHNMADGALDLVEMPWPQLSPNGVLVRTTRSLVSAGTERMLVEFGKANLVNKARQQPARVREVLQKARTDGILETVDAVRSKLQDPIALGYSNVGTVLEVGAAVRDISPGDRVLSNGPHAELVHVPQTLCAKIPANVSDEAAAFGVVGAIALQGIRLSGAAIGEAVVVIGLGLIGQVTVQLLLAQGCRVLGIDLDPHKCELAGRFGAEVVNPAEGADILERAHAFSRGRGVDAVLVTATSKSDQIVHEAALMCRKRGRIVLVGQVGLNLSRADFYEKELTFQVSASYGPGRYDPGYEGGHDYPVGFVRWTAQRNFEAVLDAIAAGGLRPEALVSQAFPFADFKQAYERLQSDPGALGLLLTYPPAEDLQPALRQTVIRLENAAPPRDGAVRVGVIGAGNFAKRILLPALKEAGAAFHTLAVSGNASAAVVARRFGFRAVATDPDRLFADPDVDAIIISTRHDSHARFVCAALAAGKHVFVEKPLALNRAELANIELAYSAAKDRLLMVGFNRRFAPSIRTMRDLLRGVGGPMSIIMTVNAGAIPPDHWTQDSQVGGGRIVGEGCHFVDLMRFLVGAPITRAVGLMMGPAEGVTIRDDKASFTLGFADGSFGTVHYLANGNKAVAKERIEVYCKGRVLQLDNYRRLRGFGWAGFSSRRYLRLDKGQVAEMQAFLAAVKSGGASPIPFSELMEVSEACLDVADVLNEERPFVDFAPSQAGLRGAVSSSDCDPQRQSLRPS